MNKRGGYTLVELLIFLAISTVALAAFIGILVLTLRLQVKQSSSGSVQQESTAFLQQVQYYVQNSSLVDTAIDTSASTLKLRMSSSTIDPTVITLASGTAYLQQGGGTLTALTSNRVTVSNLSFVRHVNPPGNDTVSISFTMAYNSPNLQQLFTQSFQTAVTQVSAATFDSNILPASSPLNLGVTGSVWNSVNNVIYFSGSNVGIGISSPQASLDVSGGNIFVDTPGKGIKLRDATNGNCWLVTVNASGTLSSASALCTAP